MGRPRIAVIGASGFLGRLVWARAAERGLNCVALDERPGPTGSLVGSFSAMKQELASRIDAMGDGPVAVLHLAGMANAGDCEKSPEAALSSNLDLAAEVLEFLRERYVSACHFLLASTGLLYQPGGELPFHEDSATHSGSIYLATKLGAEALAEGYAGSYGIHATAVRLGNIYGADSAPGTVVGKMLGSLREGRTPSLQDFTPIRDFTYIEDVAKGLLDLSLGAHPGGFRKVNLSRGVGHSVEQMARAASRAFSVPDSWVGPAGGSGASKVVLNNDRLRGILGWSPDTDPDEAFRAIARVYAGK